MFKPGLLALGFLIACGGGSGDGGSGVDSDAAIVDLSAAEVTDVCEYVTDVLPERTVDCGDGDTITVGEGGVTECTGDYTDLAADHPDCELTVGDVEACAEAFAALSDEELCSMDSFPAACAPILAEDCF
ncbi:MAG: hypothetical protein ABI867_01860 [Kofleriaceae bacterium]